MSEQHQLPWSDTCFVCGDANPFGLRARFLSDEDGTFLTTIVRPEFEGYPGRVHGGVVTALLDETIGWACSVRAHKMYFTAELKVRFKHPVPGGVELTVRGRCIELRRKAARGEGHIEDAAGTVLAMASGIYFPVPEAEEARIIPMLKMPGRRAIPGDF